MVGLDIALSSVLTFCGHMSFSIIVVRMSKIKINDRLGKTYKDLNIGNND